MKIIGRTLLAVLIGLAAGCDLEVYRTNEGLGIIGPAGGYFMCDDETNCYGTQGE